MNSLPASPSENSPSMKSGATAALWLLLGINLFNYIDRQVLSAVLPKLALDATLFTPGDPNQKRDLGLLTSAFLVSYMVLSPIFGRLGDTRSRWLLVGIGVIIWSLASGGSGLATSYTVLLLTRCLVGVGEAAYGPVAPSMLSDLYPERDRGRILSRLISRDSRRQRAGVRHRRTGRGHNHWLARGVPGCRTARITARRALPVHEGTAAIPSRNAAASRLAGILARVLANLQGSFISFQHRCHDGVHVHAWRRGGIRSNVHLRAAKLASSLRRPRSKNSRPKKRPIRRQSCRQR